MMFAQKFEEKIFRRPDGTLVLKGIKSVGVDHAVDFSEKYRADARHFERGNGWPQSTPRDLGEPTIWQMFKN